MSVVQIDIKDPTSGPKIFDSLNSRQEPMTVGDLIRNEIFSRVEMRIQTKSNELIKMIGNRSTRNSIKMERIYLTNISFHLD
jgi:hypothetical protein